MSLIHQDEQGSTAYVIGQGREIENIYQYDTFGNLLKHKENLTNRILYTGQQYDQETGQCYLRARYYNPVVGRFLQEDTYRGDGLNLYTYCANNPVVYFDPSGHACDRPEQSVPPNTQGDQAVNGDGSNSKVDNIIKQVEAWLGENVRAITNKNGDKVFTSEDGTKRLRFDINNTSPHKNPHGHVEEFIDGKWIKSGPIYPIDVPHN